MTTIWGKYKLYPHQTWPAEIMACEKGARSQLLYYLVGAGKTLTALYTIHQCNLFWNLEQFPRVYIIAPVKTLTEVWEKAINDTGLPRDRFVLKSFENARIHYKEYVKELRAVRRAHLEGRSAEFPYRTFLIVDEAHIVRNTSTAAFLAVFAIAAEVDKLLLLTGTPMVNSVHDMQAPLRILTDDLKVTIKENFYIDPETRKPRHIKHFASLFEGYVLTYLVPLKEEDWPSVDSTVTRVPMYPLQKERYLDFDAEMLTPALRELMRQGVISTALNSFLTRTRAISNTLGKYTIAGKEVDTPEKSAKFQGIKEALLKDSGPAVVYSFYLDNGVLPLKKFIDETTSLRTALLTGKTTGKQLAQILKDYNVNRTIDVLFMTSSVRQGITLLRTRAVHIMEPGFNESLQEQVKGRTIRYLSHADLPENERHVQVYYWVTTLGSGARRVSTDEYIYQIAQNKMVEIEFFEEILAGLKKSQFCKKL